METSFWDVMVFNNAISDYYFFHIHGVAEFNSQISRVYTLQDTVTNNFSFHIFSSRLPVLELCYMKH